MVLITNKGFPRLKILLLLAQIECIVGFTGSSNGFVSVGLSSRLLSRPYIPALRHRIDLDKSCDDVKVDADGVRKFPKHDRRLFLSSLVVSSIAAGSPFLSSTENANALPFIGGSDRRQLELCLVTILRTEYWATNTARLLKSRLLPRPMNENVNATDTINSEPQISENQRKQPYLEARLGAKALLTQKIGGGANSRVVKLGGFQLKECLDDARYWCGELAKSNQLPSQQTGELSMKQAKRICSIGLSTAAEDLVESLASLVEFDGLETTVDPSPRSSLMLSMYTPQKGTFVYRTLVERVVPSCERFLKLFGKERMRVVEEYVRREYADEVPFEVLEKLYGNQQ